MNRYKGICNLPVLCTLIILFSSPVDAVAQPSMPPSDWHAWQFLLGAWVGEGSGGPGQGEGGFTFSAELQGRILVRRNEATYPETKERPSFRHDDLMVIYRDTDGSTKGEYYDNEGHVIHYDVVFVSDSSSVVFTSPESNSEPRYRLTYTKAGGATVSISFEIAPPGKPEGFHQYLQAAAHRKER